MKSLMANKKGASFMDALQGIGIGIVGLAIVIGVGVVVLDKFGNSTGGSANTTVQYLITQMGSTGLAGWVPAIIALVIGLLFLGAFVSRGSRSF